MKKGDKVIYLKDMKGLDKDSIGILQSIDGDNCIVYYPQNVSFETDSLGNIKPIKGALNKVSMHSAKLNDLKLYQE